jgi:hypothetical protein
MKILPAHDGLDCSTGNAAPYDGRGLAYENTGSGAFDANHVFGTGPWAISDRTPVADAAVLGRQYWIAPESGLRGCAGALTFESTTTGAGQFEIGLRRMLVAPMTRTTATMQSSRSGTVSFGTCYSMPTRDLMY